MKQNGGPPKGENRYYPRKKKIAQKRGEKEYSNLILDPYIKKEISRLQDKFNVPDQGILSDQVWGWFKLHQIELTKEVCDLLDGAGLPPSRWWQSKIEALIMRSKIGFSNRSDVLIPSAPYIEIIRGFDNKAYIDIRVYNGVTATDIKDYFTDYLRGPYMLPEGKKVQPKRNIIIIKRVLELNAMKKKDFGESSKTKNQLIAEIINKEFSTDKYTSTSIKMIIRRASHPKKVIFIRPN